MRRAPDLGACAMLLSMLCACAMQPPEAPPVRSSGFHQAAPQTHTVHFADGATEPAADERERLRAFLQVLAPGRITFFELTGAAGKSTSSPVLEKRKEAVAELVRAHGFERARIMATARADKGVRNTRPGDVEVHARAWVAGPDCGPSGTGGAELGSVAATGLGCASAANLLQMVDDPLDLSGPRSLGDADGYQAAEAVRRYRTDKVKPLVIEPVGP